MTPEELIQVLTEADCLYSVSEIDSAIKSHGNAITAQLDGHAAAGLHRDERRVGLAARLLLELNFPPRPLTFATRYRGDIKGRDLHLESSLLPMTSQDARC